MLPTMTDSDSNHDRHAGNEHAWVSLTTDYGLRDGFVAACRGVIATIAPHATAIDISHDVPPQDVRAGAAIVAQTAPYLPTAVHLVVVDPGVGTTRRGLVVVAEHGLLVGPDNGVLLPPARALGGIRHAIELSDPSWWLPGVTRTFHGRDVFAPVTAQLATGTPPSRMGRHLPTPDLVEPPTAISTMHEHQLRTEVVLVDRFGNLQLATPAGQLPWHDPPHLHLRTRDTDRWLTWATTFADVAHGQPLALVDSAGWLALAVNGGSAAHHLDLEPGDIVDLEPDQRPHPT